MSYKPAVIGEIRGPFNSSWNSKPTGGVAYMVYGQNGWVDFRGAWSDRKEIRKKAEEYATRLKMMDVYGVTQEED